MKKCDSYVQMVEKKFDLVENEIKTRNYGRCLGTKEIDECKCGGNTAECDFYPEKRCSSSKKVKIGDPKETVAKIVKPNVSRIYYAHHQWKYGTKIEEFEIEMIRKAFPKMDIFNPATDLKTDGLSEEEIMKQCLKEVDASDLVVFTTMDGYIGKGVLEEIRHAQSNGKVVLWFIGGEFRTDFAIDVILIPISDRLYATVYAD